MNISYQALILKKIEILEELGNVKYKDLKHLVYRMQLTYDEIMDILDLKYIPTKTTAFSLNPRIYEVVDFNNSLKNILHDNVKVSVTIDDARLKSKLKNNQTLIFIKKWFFYTISRFTQLQQGALNDIEGFYQILPGSYKSDKSINDTGIDKIHLKCDCIQSSIVNGLRETIWYNFALSSPPGHKRYKEPRIKLFKKINKSVLSHILFYFEEDDRKPVDFNRETISFTCQPIEIQNSHLNTYHYMSIYFRDISRITFVKILQLYEYIYKAYLHLYE